MPNEQCVSLASNPLVVILGEMSTIKQFGRLKTEKSAKNIVSLQQKSLSNGKQGQG